MTRCPPITAHLVHVGPQHLGRAVAPRVDVRYPQNFDALAVQRNGSKEKERIL